MEFGSFEEFRAASNRLYESTAQNREDIRELRESTRELREAAMLLASAVERDHKVIMEHERRPDRTEITVEAILEDLRRHREGRSSQ